MLSYYSKLSILALVFIFFMINANGFPLEYIEPEADDAAMFVRSERSFSPEFNRLRLYWNKNNALSRLIAGHARI
jgi:hypothetical protein